MKIICIGRNYIDHAKELNNPVPSKPLIFMKPSTALLINNKPFYFPDFSKKIHFEVELILRICKNGKHIQPKFANDYIDQIGLGLDLTARDIQDQCKAKGHPWEVAKAFDHSAVIGKFLPVSQFPNLKNIGFSLRQNNMEVQNGNSKDLIFDFEYIVSYVSSIFTLHIGDYIFTGTPAGVGPIKIGDQFQGYINDELLLNCDIK